MKKQVPVFVVCAVAALGVAVGASAVGVIRTVQSELRPDFTIVIDGQEKTFTDVNGNVVYPLLYEGTTYLPVRAIGNMMGKTVYWYEDEKRIELKDSQSTVTDADVIVSGGQSQNGGSSGSGGTVQQPAGSEITLEQAKQIALDQAGLTADQVQFTEAKLDSDDGRREYDIEFWANDVEYSAEILVDGTVRSWKVDGKMQASGNSQQATGNEITLEQAKQIALDNAGLTADQVQFTKTELDSDDGRREYEIEFWVNGVEYAADIRASDGFVLSMEIDRD